MFENLFEIFNRKIVLVWFGFVVVFYEECDRRRFVMLVSGRVVV